MQIELVAYTVFNESAFAKRYNWAPAVGDTEVDALAEAAGRISYGSWSRPNPATATNATYLGNILRQGHESVFEHPSATFLVTGASRDMLLQLERHRHTSYSVRSQRYQDESDGQIAIEHEAGFEATKIFQIEYLARNTYRELVEYYQDTLGWGRKQARERARLVLPGGWETEFLVTANLRAWRYVINLRGSEHADAQIREFAVMAAQALQAYAPNVMQDLEFYTHKGVLCVRIKEKK